MKTIFIISPSGTTTRDILRSNGFNNIFHENPDIRFILFSPACNDIDFINEFKLDNIKIHCLNKYSIVGLEWMYTRLRYFLFGINQKSSTRTIANQKFISENNNLLIKILALLLSKKVIPIEKTRCFLKNAHPYIFIDNTYANYFETYSPNLIFIIHPYYDTVLPMLKIAIRKKVPVIAQISSWDNLTSKGELPTKIDKLIVWNKIMKSEAINIHSFLEENVFVSGIPQFDIYYHNKKEYSREEFYNSLNLDINKKLIVYTTVPPTIGPCDPDIIKIILNFIESKKIIHPSQLLVRLHPKDNINRYYELKSSNNIIWDNINKKSEFPDNWNPSVENISHLADTMKYADLIINIASTTTIDAAYFNTPIINIAYDGFSKQDYLSSIRRYYDFEHYKKIVNTKGIKIVYNNDELLVNINKYLTNPNIDSKQREFLIKEQCEYLDDKSGERIKNFILKELSEIK